ncbi:MAG: hypothetical protein PHZ24_13945 [Bacteroidales bacterium]|nr:hypothetical protein [Bacteroidales bacterium]
MHNKFNNFDNFCSTECAIFDFMDKLALTEDNNTLRELLSPAHVFSFDEGAVN